MFILHQCGKALIKEINVKDSVETILEHSFKMSNIEKIQKPIGD